MTQASVLKVTANGTTTSPVLRGHWIMERILGLETPPPPPTVAAVEPDIRGAVTIRQQLDKHRANASCAVLPPQDRPAGLRPGELRRDGRLPRALPGRVRQGGPGQGLRHERAGVRSSTTRLPVDSAGELPDGRPFKDVRELKKLLAQDEVPIARNLVRQLTVYATGAPVRFSDRDGDREDPRRGEGQPVRRAEHRPRDRAERAVPEQVSEARR